MVKRWGWLAVAVLVAAVAGCAGEETRDDEGMPPTEEGVVVAPEGEGMPAEGEAPAPEGTPGEAPAPEAPAGETPAPEAAPAGEGGTAPAGAPPAAAATTEPLMLEAAWSGEPGKSAVRVKVGADEVAQFDPAQSSEVIDPVVSYLKSKRDAMAQAGVQPKVVLKVPATKDMPFKQVGQPLMKSAFRAGFRGSEIEYRPVAGQ